MSLVIISQSKCYTEIDRKTTQSFINNSTINTIKITAQEKSDARDKIHRSNNSNISHPIQNLDSITSKKPSQQNILSIKNPCIQHITKNTIPRISQKSCLPRIKSKNNRK